MPEMSPRLSEAFNNQIKMELDSAYLYLAMSAESSAQTLKGTAHWLRMQWQEESGHAMKLIDYVLERGNALELMALDQPSFSFKSITDLFQKVLEHEQSVTRSIHELVSLVDSEQDHAAHAFLQWFVLEQVEEENSAQEVLDTLKIAGDQGPSLLMMDRELGSRVAETEA